MTDFDDAVRNLWRRVQDDTHRTVLCPPEHVAGLEEAVKARGLDHVLTVRANLICPDVPMIVLTDLQLVRMQLQWPKGPDRRPILARLPTA